MSDKKKDQRLVELMTEFLESKDPDVEEGEEGGFAIPGLDNKKMLDAIEKHRNEIEELKNQLQELTQKVSKNVEVKKSKSDAIAIKAPEVVALQSSIAKHETQIGDLLYKHKMLKTDVEQEQEKERKTTGFGSLGWLLLISNILLWSIMGYLLWKKAFTSNTNATSSSSIEKTINTAPLVADSNNVENLTASDSLAANEGTNTIIDSTINQELMVEQSSKEEVSNDNSTNTSSEVTTNNLAEQKAIKKKAELQRMQKAKKLEAANAEKARIAKEKEAQQAIQRSKRKTEAQKYAERMNAKKKINNKAKKTIKKVAPKKKPLYKEAPNPNNPVVEFGD